MLPSLATRRLRKHVIGRPPAVWSDLERDFVDHQVSAHGFGICARIWTTVPRRVCRPIGAGKWRDQDFQEVEHNIADGVGSVHVHRDGAVFVLVDMEDGDVLSILWVHSLCGDSQDERQRERQYNNVETEMSLIFP